MNLKINLALLALLAMTNVSAGDKGGNGGDAVVCGDKIVLLDSYEMTKRGFVLNLPGEGVSDKVSAVAKRLKKVDPYRALKLEIYSIMMARDVLYRRIEKLGGGSTPLQDIAFTSDDLSDIPDSLEITIPKGCEKLQLVAQREPIFPEDRRYTIAEALWDKMNVDEQALTVLHEAWYRVLLEEGAEDSRFTRYINGYLASTKADDLTLTSYLELLKLAKKMGSFPEELQYLTSFEGIVQKLEFAHMNHGEFVFHVSSTTQAADYILKDGRKAKGTRFESVNLDSGGNLISLNNGRTSLWDFEGVMITGPSGYCKNLEQSAVSVGPYQIKRKYRCASGNSVITDYETISINPAGEIINFYGNVNELKEEDTIIKKTSGLGGFFGKSFYISIDKAGEIFNLTINGKPL